MKSILVLDDDMRICDELAEFLIHRNYEVHTACRPSIAREMLSKRDIELVFLDINLPEIDGLSFLKEVKSRYPGLEVIMISSSISETFMDIAHKLGAFEYLCKPIHFSEIARAINQINHTGGKS